MAASIFPLKDITERVCLVTSETGPGRGLSRSNERTIKKKKKKSMRNGGWIVLRLPVDGLKTGLQHSWRRNHISSPLLWDYPYLL